MKVQTLKTLQKAIKDEHILTKYNLDRIGIFGSFARGEKAKDIDFYIDADSYELENLINLKRDLENISQMEVDIMLKKYANPIILYRAQKDMIYVIQ